MSRSEPVAPGASRPATDAGHGLPRTTTLRLSVTDRCDLRCRYCRPGERVATVPGRQLADLDELGGAAAWLVQAIGVERIRLTGGEPLARPGLESLVGRLVAIPGVREVTMTSNGTRLAARAAGLKRAGLARVNISLDTLDPGRFATLTRGGKLGRVLDGIAAARAAGLAPIKLNSVLRRSNWREDVPALLDYAVEHGDELRFIELMRAGDQVEWASAEFVAAAEVREWLVGSARPAPSAGRGSAPARREVVRWRGRDVTVGWITPVSQAFCSDCDRVRLDARGRLRRCLMDAEALPLLELLRRDDDGPARAALDRFLRGKRPPDEMGSSAPMSAVGG